MLSGLLRKKSVKGTKFPSSLGSLVYLSFCMVIQEFFTWATSTVVVMILRTSPQGRCNPHLLLMTIQ